MCQLQEYWGLWWKEMHLGTLRLDCCSEPGASASIAELEQPHPPNGGASKPRRSRNCHQVRIKCESIEWCLSYQTNKHNISLRRVREHFRIWFRRQVLQNAWKFSPPAETDWRKSRPLAQNFKRPRYFRIRGPIWKITAIWEICRQEKIIFANLLQTPDRGADPRQEEKE